MDQPNWLGPAWRELGQAEVRGSRDNPRIMALFRDAGHPGIRHDETAWCAAFVSACLERSGVRSARTLRARAYVEWGDEVRTGRLGAIAVLTRGSNPAFGHVGFLVGETAGQVILLGGNQSNAVTVQAFDKARLLSLRWPATARTGPAPEPQADAAPAGFDVALAHVLRMEGGFSDDPYDPGGPTNRGITLRVYASHKGTTLDATNREQLKSELKSIPDATVRSIYLTRYWRPAGCEQMPAGIALMHFDAAVNHGVGTAIRSLQQALGVAADGVIGPLTRRALATSSPTSIIEKYAAIREARYRRLHHFWRFGRGWLNRVAATRKEALRVMGTPRLRDLVRQPTPQPATIEGDDTMTLNTGNEVKTKWWGHSLTIWGAIVTAMATVLPVMGPVIGLEVSAEIIRQLGGQVGSLVQALAGLTGTVMTIYGRVRATSSLTRKNVSVRL